MVAATFIISSLLTLSSAAQVAKPWQLPSELRPELESRLHLFMQAQAEGRWDEVAIFLGQYRRGSSYTLYTPAHKACLISQMKTAPMVDFTFTVQESPFSSEILTTPAGRRWWTLIGEGLFREGAGTVRRKTWIIAYRDQDKWYFTPANVDDHAWARAHLAPDELSKDHHDEVELLLPRDCPLEVVDLHLFIDANNLSSRHLQFRLRNKTAERISGYSFEIGDARQDGAISVGTGAPRDRIEPGGISRIWEENYNAYLYWCEGEAKMRVEIQEVNFADGTTWKAPRSTLRDKQQK